jgi:putative DNA methylase
MTVYYAFKQADEDDDDEDEEAPRGTTGWETLLEALVGAGFRITGTWPVRASQRWRQMSMGMNSLASYIVLCCRPKEEGAPQGDRRSFLAELRRELPLALRRLQQGNIAPVDFAQAAIGPGMSIYSRYRRILESDGTPMPVRTALSLINQTLTEVLSEQEDEFDSETRWAIAWFEQYGFAEGAFGDAELLSKAKVTSVEALQRLGLIRSRGGRVKLLAPDELASRWDPTREETTTAWKAAHQLLRLYFHEKAGDLVTADLMRRIGPSAEVARDLAYRLFDVCEKKKRSQEAQGYNALVLGWPEIARLARVAEPTRREQVPLFGRG